jgi:Uma2 family endonuclease
VLPFMPMSSTLDRIPPGRIRLTYDDYVGLPDDGKRYEILDGELSVSPAPTSRHQIASINLSTVLNVFVRQNRLGRVLEAPTDVILASTTIVQPDILFVRAERATIISERGVEGPPDLHVEILSTWTARQDRTTKATLYARFTIPHYWIVDAEARTIELYELDDGSYRLVTRESGDATIRPALFPGLEIRLAEIWE